MPNFYVLNVGHGNCSILSDTNITIIIDAGPKAHLLEFLKYNDIFEVEVLLISHADKDHIGGAIALLASDEINLKRVYLNPDSTKGTKSWDDLVYTLNDKHQRGELFFEPSLTSNLNGKLDYGNINLEILAPNQYIVSKGAGSKDRKGRKLNTNSLSVVFRLSCDGKPIAIVPGDIDYVGLINLLEDHKEIPAWLLIFPHHGGKTTTGNIKEFTNILCQRTKPEVIVFSIKDNKEKYPNNDVVLSIAESLDKCRLITTRSSEVLLEYIEKNGEDWHNDNVGNINFDLSVFPPSIEFEIKQ